MSKYIISENMDTGGWDIKKYKDDEEQIYGHCNTASEARFVAIRRCFNESIIYSSLGDKVALCTFIFSVLIFLLKFLAAIIGKRYNAYFSIPPSWNSRFLSDIISQIMYYGGIIVFLTITNLIIYYFIAYTKKLFYICMIMLSVIISIIGSIFLKLDLKGTIISFICLFIAMFCLGISFGISKRISGHQTKQENNTVKDSANNTVKKTANNTFFNILIFILVLIGFGALCYLGNAFAQSKSDFQIINVNNQPMLIMAENDTDYLTAHYEISNGKMKIFTESFGKINKNEVTCIKNVRTNGNIVVKQNYNLNDSNELTVPELEQIHKENTDSTTSKKSIKSEAQ